MIVELLSATLIGIIAIVFLVFTGLTMPTTIMSILTILLLLTFLVFAGFLLKGKPNDEREMLHSLLAGKISYIVGIGLLVTAITIQTFMHNIDIWLIITLCVMVFTRIIAIIYSNKKM